MVFLQFLKRDFYSYKSQIKDYLINFGLVRPFLFAISFAYLQANVIFQTQQKEMCTFFLIGNMMIILMVLTFSLSFKLLFDLEGKRFIEYQISHISPKLLFLERILFSTLFTLFVMLPFFPMTKLILQSYLVTTHTSWIEVFVIMWPMLIPPMQDHSGRKRSPPMRVVRIPSVI